MVRRWFFLHAQDARIGKNRSQHLSGCFGEHHGFRDFGEFDEVAPKISPKTLEKLQSDWDGPVCPWCCPLRPDWQRWWDAEANNLSSRLDAEGLKSGSFQGRVFVRCLSFWRGCLRICLYLILFGGVEVLMMSVGLAYYGLPHFREPNEAFQSFDSTSLQKSKKSWEASGARLPIDERLRFNLIRRVALQMFFGFSDDMGPFLGGIFPHKPSLVGQLHGHGHPPYVASCCHVSGISPNAKQSAIFRPFTMLFGSRDVQYLESTSFLTGDYQSRPDYQRVHAYSGKSGRQRFGEVNGFLSNNTWRAMASML